MLERRSPSYGLWVVSFILAFLAWLYIRFGGTLVNAKASEMHLTVPIEITGLPTDERAHFEQTDAALVVAGESHDDSAISATLNLAGLMPGTYHIPLEIRTGNTVLSVAPANELVTITKENS